MTLSVQFMAWNTFREREEGGYSDDPSDHGGATKYGISQSAHPNVDIANLTREQANEIAKAEYWDAVHGDELPWPINAVLADFAFHSGPLRASKELARELGIAVDTDSMASLVKRCLEAAEKRGSKPIAEALHLRRVAFLSRLIQGNASQVKFAGGWFARCVRLAFLIS